MNLSVGIVGLPNAGKSTLFNALLQRQIAQTRVFPFTTIDPNHGVVEIPDENLPKLKKVFASQKVTPVSIEIVDIAGLIKNAHQGEGLGNQFLGHIRTVQAILHVVRGFERSDVPHVHTQIDPVNDISTIETELALADIESLQKQLNKLNNHLKAKTDSKELRNKILLGEKILETLDQDKFIADTFLDKLDSDGKKTVQSFNLLSTKPTLYVVNLSEADLSNPAKMVKLGQQVPGKAIFICAKLEEELIGLEISDKKEYLDSCNIKSSAINQLIEGTFGLLGLITFYTGNQNETRAWPLPKGSPAINAAQTVHTDFANKFIKVEAVNAQRLISTTSWQKAKDKGVIRVEGKGYKVVDRDVLLFRVGT